MDRRKFIGQSAFIASLPFFQPVKDLLLTGKLNRIGVQLFSLPKMLDINFEAAITMLAEMGYKEAELFGPYPFSTASTQARWNNMAPALGLKGSGFFGRSIQQVREVFTKNDMSIPSLHTDIDTLQHEMGKLAEAAKALGSQYVTLPAIPEEYRKSLDDYKKTAGLFNKIGAAAKAEGIRFAYHNHGYGFKETDGKIPVRVLLDNTDPALVFLEMDVFWTSAGGADPVSYLNDYSGRYKLMHLKDMSKKMRFSGDGNNSKEWIELFPYMTTAGNGVLKLDEIVAVAQKTGVDHFIVEQDLVAEPEVALKKSFGFLHSL